MDRRVEDAKGDQSHPSETPPLPQAQSISIRRALESGFASSGPSEVAPRASQRSSSIGRTFLFNIITAEKCRDRFPNLSDIASEVSNPSVRFVKNEGGCMNAAKSSTSAAEK